MYAVIRVGGKQYKVSEGEEILIEKIADQEEGKLKFEDVLIVKDDNGIHLGEELARAYVEAEIVDIDKGPKVIVFKYRPKKRYRRKTGHRQKYLRVKITKIAFGKAKKEKKETAEEAIA